MKSINIILAFHAQEPSWDLPARVLDTLRDDDVRREAVPNDNWVRRRAESGRDIYRDLLALGEKLGAPLCLEATNEILMQVRRYMPETLARLGDAYASGALYPVYGNAVHTHIAMLTDGELADELRLNIEYLHDALGAPRPRHPGAFPMEGSIDARKLDGFRRAGMEYVIFPNIARSKMRYAWEEPTEGAQPPPAVVDAYGNFNIYTAFTIGDGLLALPRHFRISQEIWRPITKWQPHRLAPQGYILGKFAVLDEEYRNGAVEFPITREQAVDEYAQTLRDAIAEAPDGALMLYIQDLELMDFGEEALEILGEAWTRVRSEGIADVRFVTPDEYIDGLLESRAQTEAPAIPASAAAHAAPRTVDAAMADAAVITPIAPHPGATALSLSQTAELVADVPQASTLGGLADGSHPPTGAGLPHLRFAQASWAPEIRLVLRSDGHYPPLHAGPFCGIDNDEEVFRRWPFIFWEPGRFIADTFRTLLESYGVPLAIPLTAQQLDDAIAGFSSDLAPAARAGIHLRAMQRACNFGWQPDEDRHKWPYMHGLAICEIVREREGAANFTPLPERALRGLDRVLEIIVDTRVAYLRRGIERLGDRAGDPSQRAAAEEHLRNAEKRRARASALVRTLRAENTKSNILPAKDAIDARAVDRMLALLQEHCKEAFLSINELQRAWMEIQDTAGMIEEMYAYLYDLYPPLMPEILRDLGGDPIDASLV
jgi:hypothetical protein